jgi:hypothetical protein
MMRRVAISLALALCLVGCTSKPVKLLTHSGPIGMAACCVPYVAGPLLPDEVNGVVVRVEDVSQAFSGYEFHPAKETRTLPVTWPEGYTGRGAGSEVEVLNGSGEVVVRTGERVICFEEFSTKAWFCERTALDAAVEPPPPFDVASVKTRFAAECEDSTVLEGKTCELINIDGMHAGRDNLFVPLLFPKRDRELAQAVCEQIASAHDDLDLEPLGYEIVVIEGRNGIHHLAVCDSPPAT